VTINYWESSDIEEILLVIEKCDYYIVGFEGCDHYHEHIHAVFHLKSSVGRQRFLNYFTRQPNIQYPIKDYQAAHEYCQGYENGKLKCCCENLYLTDGVIPKDGNKKNTVTATKVINALDEGKTIDELWTIFPAYMMSNEHRIKKLINYRKEVDTHFYVTLSIDPINTVYGFFGPDIKLAVVTDLSKIELYADYDTVLYIPESDPPMDFKYWPRKVPISYKYGYEYKVIKPHNFVIKYTCKLDGYRLI